VTLYFGRIRIRLGVDHQLLLWFYPINFLVDWSHQAEIVVKRLIQATAYATKVGAKPRSGDCNHTVAVKTRFNLLGHAFDDRHAYDTSYCHIWVWFSSNTV